MDRCPRCNRPSPVKIKDVVNGCCLRSCAESSGLSDEAKVSIGDECEMTRLKWIEELLAEAWPIVDHYQVTHGTNELAARIDHALGRK